MTYLADKNPHGESIYPRDPKSRASVQRFLAYNQYSALKPLDKWAVSVEIIFDLYLKQMRSHQMVSTFVYRRLIL